MDYSKWDRLARELSSDEDSASEEYRKNSPQITKFNAPQQITINPINTKELPNHPNNSETSTLSSTSSLSTFTRNGKSIYSQTNDLLYSWGQSKSHVHLFIPLSNNKITSKSLIVQVFLTSNENTFVPHSNNPLCNELHVISKPNSILFHTQFQHFIVLDHDENQNEYSDWQITHFDSHRGILISMQKYQPISASTFWWNSINPSNPNELPIDVASIPDRLNGNSDRLNNNIDRLNDTKDRLNDNKDRLNGSLSSSIPCNSFHDNYAQALEQFRAKNAKR